MTRLRSALALAALAAVAWPAFVIVRPRLNAARTDRDIRGQLDALVRELRGRQAGLGVRTTLFQSLPPARRTGEAPANPGLSPDGLIALATLERYAAANNVSALHALGVVRLAVGDAALGVTTLERARLLAPGRGPIAADLAAAYLERGEPGDAARSLDLSESLAVPDRSAVVRFNAGLAFSRLFPARLAADRWQSTLSQEPDPEWRTVIAAQISAMQDAARRADSGTSSAWLKLLDRALPEWAGSCRDGRGEADARAAVAALGAALESSGDRSWASMRPAIAPGAGAQCNVAFARALQAYFEGRAAYRSDDMKRAAGGFETFVRGGGQAQALLLDARLYGAIARYGEVGSRETLARLRDVRDEAARAGFLHVSSRANWMIGYVQQDGAGFQEAIESYEAAKTDAVRVNDRETAASMELQIGAALDWLGDYRAGWERRDRALSELSEVIDPRASYTMYASSARAALRDGLARVGLAFTDQALQSAHAFGSPVRIAEAEVERARVAHVNGLDREAAEALDAASRTLGEAAAPLFLSPRRRPDGCGPGPADARPVGIRRSTEPIDREVSRDGRRHRAGASASRPRPSLRPRARPTRGR